MTSDGISSNAPARSPLRVAGEPARLRDLSPQQWKSGAAAWLGWLFDGLDMHLYVLVAAPFVAELLGVADQKDHECDRHPHDLPDHGVSPATRNEQSVLRVKTIRATTRLATI